MTGRVPADEPSVPDPSPGRRTFDPPRTVQVLHDNGRWYRGTQFEWVRRPTGEWRAGISHTTGPGQTYIRSVPADRLVAGVDPGTSSPR
jgi:hypothetical protein